MLILQIIHNNILTTLQMCLKRSVRVHIDIA